MEYNEFLMNEVSYNCEWLPSCLVYEIDIWIYVFNTEMIIICVVKVELLQVGNLDIQGLLANCYSKN